MKPLGRAVVSGAVGGGVWAATGSEGAVAVAVGVGVLMDVDHLYDYYRWYVRRKEDKLYLLLHAWEYSLVGLVALAVGINHPLLWAAALAHLAHVCSDQIFNEVTPWGYSIIYRWAKHFKLAHIAPEVDVATEYRKLHRLLPLSRYWQPWFEEKVYPRLALRFTGQIEAADRPHPVSGSSRARGQRFPTVGTEVVDGPVGGEQDR
jgi:hypothetical protein